MPDTGCVNAIRAPGQVGLDGSREAAGFSRRPLNE